MAVPKDAERAVRSYLTFLDDPASLVDPQVVARLQHELATTDDPVEKLRLISRLEKAREGDEAAVRSAFVLHARAWAEANDISVSSFAALGVPATVLRAAGLTGSERRTVHVHDVVAEVRRRSGQFTFADLADAVGASPMTIRKAVDGMIADGEVERLGPTPNWSQTGRAPIQFRARRARQRR